MTSRESELAGCVDAVYAFLLLMLRDAGEAERTLEEVFVQACASPASGGRPAMTLLGIAHDVAAGRWAPPAEGPDECRLLECGMDPELAALLERLPAAEREVVVLGTALGLEAGEIGAIVKRDAGAVRWLSRRALARLEPLASTGQAAA